MLEASNHPTSCTTAWPTSSGHIQKGIAMEVEAKFALRDRETFKRLRSLDEFAGYKLAGRRVKRIRDTYLDTADRRILSAGHMCRRRKQNGDVIIALKQLHVIEGPVHRREELEVMLPAYQPPAEWPYSAAREQVLQLIGDAPLRSLFGLRQTRIVCPMMAGERTVAELSLDEVHMVDDDKEQVYLELEVELAEEGTERDLDTLVAHLEVEWGLEPQPLSKFERASAFFGEELPPTPPTEYEPQPSPAEEPDTPPPSEADQLDVEVSGTDEVTVEPEEPPPPEPPISANGPTSVEIPDKRPPKRPDLEPDDSMAEAARKTLYLHFRRMLYHEPGTRVGDDIEELHDMRVASRRMRAAVRVFGDYVDTKQIKPFNKRLRQIGRALGAVRDLDVFEEKMQAYLDTLPADEQDALDPLLAVWEAERETARAKMLDYLDTGKYARFKEEFNAFLQTPGAGALSAVSKKGDPTPNRLRHVVPVAVYDRLAHVRAYDEWVTGPDVPLERLHQLRIAVKRLRYALEFFQEVLGPEAKRVIKECKVLQDHLGDLQDAGVASNLLRDFLTWGTWGRKKSKKKSMPTEPIVAPGVAAYLAAKHSEIEHLVDTFPEAWARFQNPEIGESIAAAVAVL